jgi:hypothetical protein
MCMASLTIIGVEKVLYSQFKRSLTIEYVFLGFAVTPSYKLQGGGPPLKR